MERSERIIKHCATQIKPKTELCPNIIFNYKGIKKGKEEVRYYAANEGKIYYNTYPASKTACSWCDPTAVDCSERTVFSTYSQGYKDKEEAIYVDLIDDDMMELSLIEMSKERPNLKDMFLKKHNWEFILGRRYFFFKGDSTPYLADGAEYFPEEKGKFYNKRFAKFLHMIGIAPIPSMAGPSRRNLHKFDGTYTPEIELTTSPDWEYTVSHLERWYKTFAPRPVTKGSAATKNAELLSYELESLESIGKRCPIVASYQSYGGGRKYVSVSNLYNIIEKVNDNLYVIRNVTRSLDYGERSVIEDKLRKSGEDSISIDDMGTMIEYYRTYLTPKGVKQFFDRNARNKKDPDFRVKPCTYIPNASTVQSLSVLDDCDWLADVRKMYAGKEEMAESELEMIRGFLMHKMTRMVVNEGLTENFPNFLEKGSCYLSDVEKIFLTKPGMNPKTLEDAFGMTKEQLKICDKAFIETAIRTIKLIYGEDITTQLSEEEFRRIYSTVLECGGFGYSMDISQYCWTGYKGFYYGNDRFDEKEQTWNKAVMELLKTIEDPKTRTFLLRNSLAAIGKVKTGLMTETALLLKLEGGLTEERLLVV